MNGSWQDLDNQLRTLASDPTAQDVAMLHGRQFVTSLTDTPLPEGSVVISRRTQTGRVTFIICADPMAFGA